MIARMPRHRKAVALGAAAALLLLVGYALATLQAARSSDRADRAEAVAQPLADQLVDACKRHDRQARQLRSVGLCRAAADAKTVIRGGDTQLVPIPGPPGRDGAPGANGADGTDGRDGQPGPRGAAGAHGQAGVGVPGEAGQDGSGGPPGPPGPKGEPGKDGVDGKDGAPGAQGPAGAEGRGVTSVSCEGPPVYSFTFTYDDGTTETVTCSPAT